MSSTFSVSTTSNTICDGSILILTGKDIFYAGKAFIDVHKGWADFADIINLIANTSFVFLPGLIGWSAVKRFGGSELFGIVLGLILIHPSLLNAWSYGDAVAKGTVPYWHLFGLSIQKIGYQGQVLPVLLSAYLLAKVEVWLRKRIPDAFQLLLVAPITFLIAGFYLDVEGFVNIVVVKSLVYLDDTTLLQYTESRHRPDKFRFTDFARRQ